MRTKAQEKRRARAFVASAKERRDNPACGKVAFPSRRVAEGRLCTLAVEGMTKTYRCPDCGLWHLTSQVERGPTDVRIWRPVGVLQRVVLGGAVTYVERALTDEERAALEASK